MYQLSVSDFIVVSRLLEVRMSGLFWREPINKNNCELMIIVSLMILMYGILMMLCYLLSFVMIFSGVDPYSATLIAQVVFVAVILLLGIGTFVTLRKAEEDIDDNDPPPPYEDVVKHLDCPSYNEALEMFPLV